eukprot:SAG31_NODE_6707_length_1917_cov_1.268427_4_plen_71_part_00
MTKPGKPYLNNHLRFKILYHTEPNGYIGSRIVGFEVEAFSGAKLQDSWCCAKPIQIDRWCCVNLLGDVGA